METTEQELKPLEIRRKDPLSVKWEYLTVIELTLMANGNVITVDGDTKTVMFR
jgi:hypothetical protein